MCIPSNRSYCDSQISREKVECLRGRLHEIEDLLIKLTNRLYRDSQISREKVECLRGWLYEIEDLLTKLLTDIALHLEVQADPDDPVEVY